MKMRSACVCTGGEDGVSECGVKNYLYMGSGSGWSSGFSKLMELGFVG